MAASSLVFEMEETVDGRADEQRRRREDSRGRRTTRTSDSSSSPKRLRLCDTPPSPRTAKVRQRRGAPIPSPPAVGTPPRSPSRIFDVREAHTPESNVFELEEVDQTAAKSDHVHVEAVCTPVPQREIYYVEETAWRLHHHRRRRRWLSAGGSSDEGRCEDNPSHPADDDGGDAVDDGDGDGGDVSDGEEEEEEDEKEDEEGTSSSSGDDEGSDVESGKDGGQPDDDEEEESRPEWADLKPLLPAPPLPSLPPNWSFDEKTRVLLGDLRGSCQSRDRRVGVGGDAGDSSGGGMGGGSRISREDEVFMLRMMERDDVTVVTEGLVMPEDLDPTLWSMEYLRDTVGGEVYHRFRVFERVWELEEGRDGEDGDGDGADGERDGAGSNVGGAGAGGDGVLVGGNGRPVSPRGGRRRGREEASPSRDRVTDTNGEAEVVDGEGHDVITDPHPNDVIVDYRGNSRVGNNLFNTLRKEWRDRYLALNPSKLRGHERRRAMEERLALAEEIVRAVRGQDPPGRFLRKLAAAKGSGVGGSDADDASSTFYEVLGERECINKAHSAMGRVLKARAQKLTPPPLEPDKSQRNEKSCTAVRRSSTVPAATLVSSLSPPGGAKNGAMSASAVARPSLPPPPAAVTGTVVETAATKNVPPRKGVIRAPAAAEAAQRLLPPPPPARHGYDDGNDEHLVISEPHANDVIIQVGSQENLSSQVGNTLFKALASEWRERYLAFKRRGAIEERWALAEQLVRAIQAQNPPGRFLKKVSGRVGANGWPLYEVLGEKGRIERAKLTMDDYVKTAPVMGNGDDDGNDLCLDSSDPHSKWVRVGSGDDQESDHRPIVSYPRENDVIIQMGQRRNLSSQMGNNLVNALAFERSERYLALNLEKLQGAEQGPADREIQALAEEIVGAVRGLRPPGRFLRKVPGRVDTDGLTLYEVVGEGGCVEEAKVAMEDAGKASRKGSDNDDDRTITYPHLNDVIIQVGGQQSVSSWVGNKLLAALAFERKERYQALDPNKLRGAECKAAITERQALAEEIVRAVKAQDPPGRFLKKLSDRVSADGSTLYEVVGEKACIEKSKRAMGYVGKVPPPHLNGNSCTAVQMASTVPSGTGVSLPSSSGAEEGVISTFTTASPSCPPPLATEFATATEPANGHHHQQRNPCPWAESCAEAKTMKEPSPAVASGTPSPPPGTAAPKSANGDHPAHCHSHSHNNVSKDVAKSAPAPAPSPSRSTRRAAAPAAAASKRPVNGHHHLHVHRPVAVSSSSPSHGQRSSTLPSPPPSPPPPTSDAVPQVGAAATPTNADGDGEDGRHRRHYPVLGQGHKRYHVTHREIGSCRALRVRDFVRYLDERERQLSAMAERAERRRRMRTSGRGCCAAGSSSSQWQAESPEEEAQCRRNGRGEEMFRYEDEDGIERSFNCVDTVLYMIDYDMVKLLPALHRDFVDRFRFPEILPGEAHCLMNKINPGGRPFMGPNLYVTPPSAFTHFHQDGHGTVDSGHQCLSGYNEVIMLRRMTEEHKKHALFLLNGEDPIMYDALYGLPHADGKRDMPQWPSSEDIQQCRDMNYYPSVFVLKPGQFVHINKGRLHAFRKMAPTQLPERDCHFDLRSTLLAENPDLADVERLCVSVAWDWTYKGITSDGTNRETAAVLECASLNRKNQTNSLAIPETSILYLARELSNKGREEERSEAKPSSTKNLVCSPIHPQPYSFAYQPKSIVALRGILPSLRHVVERHKAAYLLAREGMTQCNGPKVSVASRPNSWENPQLFTLDPYGNDFFCKLCHEELSNLYMHCDGCEMILNKDFNICVSCHSEGKYKVRVQMHPLNEKKHSTINHTGDFHRNRQSRCPCKNGPVCRNCSYCAGCSCKCHQHFTLQYRFMDINDEVKLLERVEGAVGSRRVRYGAETEERLLASRPLPSIATSALTCEAASCDRRGSEDLEEHQASEMVPVNGVKRKGTTLFPNGLEAARRKTDPTKESEKGKVESVCNTERRMTGRARRK